MELKNLVQAQTCGLVKINKNDLLVKEFNGQRVVTFKDVDMLHERAEGTAKRNFSENKEHFIVGVDYFNLTFEEVRSMNFVPRPNSQGLTIITEGGYLMLVKSLQDDLAWKVQRELVNNYFRVKEQQPTCIEDVLIASLKEMKEVKHKIQEVESKQIETKEEIQAMRDVITLDSNGWRKETNRIINCIARKLGGFSEINVLKREIYKLLNNRLGVDVNRRLLEKQKRMALEGVSKSKIDKVNTLDVISEDKKLIDGYVNIIRQYALKYGV